MAFGRYRKYGSKRKSKYSYAERFAYHLGRVQRGLKNPNSRIFESYNNGLTAPERKQKTLF